MPWEWRQIHESSEKLVQQINSISPSHVLPAHRVGEYSGPFFMVVKNKELADHFKRISELHGRMRLILVWPFVGLAGYIAGVPLHGSGNTLWHPEQCLQRTTSFTLPCTCGTGIIAFNLYMFTCIGVLSGYIAYLHLGTHVRRPCEPAWY